MSESVTTIDLRTPSETAPHVSVETTEVPKQSPLWAEISKPFSILIFVILLIVIIFPFLSVLMWPSRDLVHKTILDWAKFVITPVIALCASIITYYFGSGNNSKNS